MTKSFVLHKQIDLPDTNALPFLVDRFSRAVYWENEQESFVGLGVAAAVGPAQDGFVPLAAQAAPFFTSFSEAEQGGALRFFGGANFGGLLPKYWADFGSSCFVFPRLQLLLQNDCCTARVFFLPQDTDSQRKYWRCQWENLEQTLQEKSPIALRENTLQQQTSSPDANRWKELIGDILSRIQRGEAQKIVAARQVRLEFAHPLPAGEILSRLRVFLPACTVFLFKTGASCFLGATPETLVRKQAGKVYSEALAGTAPLSCDRTAFLADTKERQEHACVLEHICGQLRPYCAGVRAPDVPVLRELSHLVHLCSPVQASLKTDMHILRLAELLHPTPAICGFPVNKARSWICDVEMAGRGWYSGPVGWFDAQGNGDFRVALRCALLRERTARLYAGAGIVQGSQADKEFQETETKLHAMRSILG